MIDLSFLRGPRPQRTPTLRESAPLQDIVSVRKYWESLRHDGGIPKRSDVDPRSLDFALDRIFVAERIGTGLAQIRISGAVLNETAGLDARGLPLSCLFAPEARLRLAAVAERVFSDHVAAEVHLQTERKDGLPSLQARLLMLPLTDFQGQTGNLMLGCLAYIGARGQGARRFQIDRAMEERLVVPVQAQAVKPTYQLAEPKAPAPKHPHLRLVYSAEN
jgi:hypothetical protein